MAQPPAHVGAMLAALRVIFRMLLVAQLAFLAVAVVLVFLRGPALQASSPEVAYALQFVVPALNIIIIGITYLLQQSRLQKARRLRNLSLKLQSYQLTYVLRAAMLQGTGLFDVVVFLQTGRPYYLLFFAGVLLLYLQRPPYPRHIVQDLGLDAREAEVLTGSN